MKSISTFFLLISLILTLSISGCTSTPESESTGEFFDSSLITAKVKARLIDDRITSGFKIKVVTFKGIVHLSGEVSSTKEKNQATKIAEGVAGVKKVMNNLIILPKN